MRVKLTEKTIAALDLPPGKEEEIFWDEQLTCFGLRIRRGGSRTWVFQYKVSSQHRKMTFGSPAMMSVARAREFARDLHAQKRLGRDPSAEKAEGRARAAETMAAVLQNYLVFKRAELRPRSYVEIERHLMKNAKSLHGLQLAKIDRRTIAGQISTIAAEKAAMTANRARAALSACFAWAVREGLADSNPVIGTNRWDEQSRDRVLSADELAVVWHAAGDDAYGTIIKLLILLGQRLNEIGGLRWSEIIDGTIQLPSERTKNGRAHGVPLSALAQGLLDSRPRVGDFVFGQHRPFTRWAKSKLELDERIEKMGGKLAHWTHHDLRRSCASGMGEIGIAPFVVETVLNHVSGHRGGIAGVYNKSDYRREKKHALELWASHVEEVVAGGGRHKVVQLRA